MIAMENVKDAYLFTRFMMHLGFMNGLIALSNLFSECGHSDHSEVSVP